MSRIPQWLRQKMLRKRVAMLAIGVGVPWSWVLWQCFGPLSAFPVSAETTRLTEPLTPDGSYVDYLRFLQERVQSPDAGPASEDTWCLLSGTRPKSSAVGLDLPQWTEVKPMLQSWSQSHPEKSVEAQRYFQAADEPIWAVHELHLSARDDVVRKFLVENEPWFAAVRNSRPTPPLLEVPDNDVNAGLSLVLLERSQQYQQRIADRFLLRAAMQFHAGEFQPGLQDARIAFIAAEGLEKFCLIPLLVSWRIRLRTNEELINGLVLCQSIDTDSLSEILNLPTTLRPDEDPVRVLDQEERFVRLDAVQAIHRDPRALPFAHSVLDKWYGSMLVNYSAHRVNFAQLLTRQNQITDGLCNALRARTYREQKAALNSVLSPLDRIATRGPGLDWTFFSYDFQSWVEGQIMQSFLSETPKSMASLLNSRRVLHLAARLAKYRASRGQFPEHISDVLEMPDLPSAPRDVLIDAFTEEPFDYERAGDLYRIRSAGPDMVAGGKSLDDMTWPNRFLLPTKPRP